MFGDSDFLRKVDRRCRRRRRCRSRSVVSDAAVRVGWLVSCPCPVCGSGEVRLHLAVSLELLLLAACTCSCSCSCAGALLCLRGIRVCRRGGVGPWRAWRAGLGNGTNSHCGENNGFRRGEIAGTVGPVQMCWRTEKGTTEQVQDARRRMQDGRRETQVDDRSSRRDMLRGDMTRTTGVEGSGG